MRNYVRHSTPVLCYNTRNINIWEATCLIIVKGVKEKYEAYIQSLFTELKKYCSLKSGSQK